METANAAGSFGDLLREYRASVGLSQEELAERAGLSRRGVSDLECGVRRKPYPATVRRLVKALGLGQADRAALLAAARTDTRRHGALDPSDPVPSHSGQVSNGTARRQHNLPVALTSFVGRGPELGLVQELLSRSRLVTLVGVGGAGKTRFALELAAHVVENFVDGAWLVELADVSDPVLVPRQVGAALGFRDDSGRPLRDGLAEYLRRRQLLLVLDNCEHLVDACADLVHGLLSKCAGLKVLATSRQALGITGEVAWQIPPLSVPTLTGESSMERIARYDAVQLFLERARVATPSLAFTDEHAASIAEVCRELDGLPLALELAAPRLRTLAPQQLAERLHDRFRLLSSGSRTAAPRHQTLRAALEWSYDLLDEPKRLVFDRVSVFAGGCTLEAAEAVCTGEGLEPGDLLDLLTSLVDRSLVHVEPGGPGEVRYKQLETLRQYGLEQLARRGVIDSTRRRHAEYFLAEAELAEPKLRGPEQQWWLERLERDHDNLRLALGWAINGGDVELGLRLAAALTEFWRRRGHIGEGQRWLERALEQAPAAPDALRAAAWYGAGTVARFVFANVAEGFFSESLALRRQLGDERGVAESLAGVATASVGSTATAQLIQALGDAQAVDAKPELLSRGKWGSHLTAASDATSEGDPEPVDALFNESLSLFHKLGDDWGIVACLSGMGNRAFARGDYSRAAGIMDAGLAKARANGDAWQTSYLLHGLGHVCWMLGNQERSLALLAEGLVLCGKVGDRRGAAMCIQSFALIAGGHELWERAARLWGAAAELRLSAGLMRWGQPWIRSPDGLTPYDAVDATRAALGEAAFTDAWTAGGALSLEEAVAEAVALRTLLSSRANQPAGHQEHADSLTQREREAAALVARGLTNRQIGAALVITEGTAAIHVKHVLAKLGFSTRAQIAAWASRQSEISST